MVLSIGAYLLGLIWRLIVAVLFVIKLMNSEELILVSMISMVSTLAQKKFPFTA
jgi:hypothetical protein